MNGLNRLCGLSGLHGQQGAHRCRGVSSPVAWRGCAAGTLLGRRREGLLGRRLHLMAGRRLSVPRGDPSRRAGGCGRCWLDGRRGTSPGRTPAVVRPVSAIRPVSAVSAVSTVSTVRPSWTRLAGLALRRVGLRPAALGLAGRAATSMIVAVAHHHGLGAHSRWRQGGRCQPVDSAQIVAVTVTVTVTGMVAARARQQEIGGNLGLVQVVGIEWPQVVVRWPTAHEVIPAHG